MKNKKTLKIQFKNIDQAKNELLALTKIKKSYIQPENVILFESLNGFRNFMTLQKLELLTIIASEKPKSIYELAQIVNRAIAPVQKDCNALSRSGFIVFEKERNGRKTLAPRLKFNYDTIIIELPDHPYEISFKAAA